MAAKNAASISETVTDSKSLCSSTKPASKIATTLLDTFDPRKTREVYNLKPDPVTGRLIDSYPGTRTIPMKVLCVGMSRTGTMTLFTALQRLGYTPYHMAVALGSPKTNCYLWCEALNAKYHGQGNNWGREEFDKLLGNYDGIADVPGNCFVQELVAAYPEAKVVLSNRDVEGWLKSMDSTGGRVLRWRWWDLLSKWDSALAKPWWDHARLLMPIHFYTMSDFSSPNTPARKAFKDHYDLVRRTVPKERLLEYRVQEGWAPLCEFLGVEVPDEDFPRVNDAQQFIFAHGMMWWLAFAKMVGKIGAMVAVPVAGVAAAMWLQGR